MNDTQSFFNPTPERILDAVEASGLKCTGRALALNSMENRVYEVEIDIEDESLIRSPSDRFRVVKFYRPGRWSKEQILEEHEFLLHLQAQEIPVIAPIEFEDGSTLHLAQDVGIFFAVFPKMGGRHPDEFNDEDLKRVGRLLARLHNVGAAKPAQHRISLTPQTYGRNNLEYLVQSKLIPPVLEERYQRVVETLCGHTERFFEGVALQRIHGDCHLGNILWGREGYFLVDFDDMVMGPSVQDLWLIIPGRDEEARKKLTTLLEGYEVMRKFDHSTLRLIEPLRALRMIHFSAWIAKRWDDPAFKRTFVEFGTERYWQDELSSLHDQLSFIEEGGAW